MPDRKKNGKDFRPLEHATTNFHASVTDMRKHDFPPKFADVMQQFGLKAFMVCYDYHKHGAHQILHKLCKKNSWACALVLKARLAASHALTCWSVRMYRCFRPA